MKKPIKRAITLIILFSFIAGCSTIQKGLSFIPGVPNPDNTKIRSVHIATTQSTNQNSAIQMDVLFLLDKNLAKSLPTTAAEWFDERSRYLTNNRQSILVAPVELSPGGNQKLHLPKGYKGAKDVIAYDNYLPSNGQKWLRLPNTKLVSVELGTLAWTFSTKK